MKKLSSQKKYYYVFYDTSFERGGQEGYGLYYKNKKTNFCLRFAVFKTGKLTALVSSRHSQKKIQKLLSKPKPLLINRCCGFKVLETDFKPSVHNCTKRWFQISHDNGKTYNDYKKGSNEKIDSLFHSADMHGSVESNWFLNDFAQIFKPHFGITEVTAEYKSGVFRLNRFQS